MTAHNRREGTQLCSLARTLEAVGERWSFLIVREAMAGTTRFSDFRKALGIASDVLGARLTTLVEVGVLRKEQYQDPGERVRDEYLLTDAGIALNLVLCALQQWGDEHVPSDVPTIRFRDADGQAVRVAFVDRRGKVVPDREVVANRPRRSTNGRARP
jgi:DNA-binding HxlR family transcriptional regulator